MDWRNHYELEGRHALLSASQYHWIRYDEEKFRNHLATRRLAVLGTELHQYAVDSIRLRQKQVKNGKTLNAYINDAIGFRMNTEQILFFSGNAFGTADAICFRDNILRIHDLKTGVNKASFDQLLVYVAFFCLEYNYDVRSIDKIELRIYQENQILVMTTEDEFNPIVETVLEIIDQLYHFEEIIAQTAEELS